MMKGAISMSKQTETVQKIAETAYKLFAEHGIDHTSMAMIASEVRISKPAIYYYYASKDALVQFLFEEICKELHFTKLFQIDAYSKSSFKAQLLTDGYQLIEDQKNDESFSRIFNEYMSLAARNEGYRIQLNEVLADSMKGFHELLLRGVSFGVVAGRQVEAKAHVLTMVIDNISNYMLMGFDLDYKAIWAEAVESVLRDE
jgi:AcrR family transcriptional regulator